MNKSGFKMSLLQKDFNYTYNTDDFINYSMR